MLNDIKRIDKEHYGNKKRFDNILSVYISWGSQQKSLEDKNPFFMKQLERDINETKMVLNEIGKYYYRLLTGKYAIIERTPEDIKSFIEKIRHCWGARRIIKKNPIFSNIGFCGHCGAVILKTTPYRNYRGIKSIEVESEGGIKDGLYEDGCLICYDCASIDGYVKLTEFNSIELICKAEDTIITYDTNRQHTRAYARTFLYEVKGEYFESQEFSEKYKATFERAAINGYHSKDQMTEHFFKFATDENRAESQNYNDGILFGMEIEVEVDNNIIKTTDCARRFLTFNDSSKFWIERDGSLDNGFEIITYPMPYKKLAEFIKSIKVIKGMSSFNKKTTGVHIHSEAKDIEREHAVNYRAFINNKTNRIFINYIAMRVNNRYSEYKNQRKKVIKHNIERGSESRYDSVNIRRYTKTIETRIFKGNLRRESLMVYLQFKSALLAYCGVSQKQSISGFAKHVKLKKDYYPQLWKRVKEFSHWKDKVLHKQVELALEQELATIYEN